MIIMAAFRPLFCVVQSNQMFSFVWMIATLICQSQGIERMILG